MPQPILGLVCLTSPTAAKSDRISYRTITRTALEKLPAIDRPTKLAEIYAANALMLQSAIEFCHRRKIGMYRMSSSAFPFADRAEYQHLLPTPELAAAGRLAAKYKIRLLSHPDQFCVLSSDKPAVIQNSVDMLTLEARVFDLIGLPRSHWAPINVHIGRKGPEALSTITAVIRDLAPGIRARLSLENDEYKQDWEQTQGVCEATGTAMLFDYHHELVAKQYSSYDHLALEQCRRAAAKTWTNPDWAVCHLSNGATGLHDRAHHDLISQVPDLTNVRWLEVEAKGKERAIELLPW
jgi:UV DNA damage endonuclease